MLENVKEQIQALWPDARIDICNSWCNTITLTSTNTLYVSFAQLMKVAAILDTDKFEVDKNKDTQTWAISEVTWDSSTTYEIQFHWKDENVGVWSSPEMKKFANELEYKEYEP
jgi:hypothetical protein